MNGSVNSDWGNDQKGTYDGTHTAFWYWTSRELMEFQLTDGVPALVPACYRPRRGGPLRCSPHKGEAHLVESSHFVQYPGDPSLRQDFGACMNDVATDGWIKTNQGTVDIQPARANDLRRDFLVLTATMVNLGTSKWDEKCWFGIGSHAAAGHEPGEDLSNLRSNSAWRGYLDAPRPARFRERGRFIENNDRVPTYSHDESSPESQNDGPHQTHIPEVNEVRFTPFRRARLPEEIEKLRRLR
jgi:hypothetical protein